MLPLVINTSAGYCLNEESLSEKTTLQLKFILDEVVNLLFNDVCSLAFRKPVCPEELELYDYPYIVKKPIDLSYIKKRLLSNSYMSTQECINDLNRMFNNCFVFNPPGTPTCVVGELLYKKMRKKLLLLEKMSLYNLKTYTPVANEMKSEHSLKRERSSNSKSKRPAAKKIKVEPVVDSGRKRRLSKSLKACQSLLKDIMSNKNSSWNYIFLSPVDSKQVKDYYDVIKNPMDLGTIWKKLDEHVYLSKDEFVADVRLVYNNCYTYNGTTNFFGKCAEALQKMFESKIDSIPNDDQDLTVVSRSKPISSFMPSSLSVETPAASAGPPSLQPNFHNSSGSKSISQPTTHSKSHNSSIFTTSPIHCPNSSSTNTKDQTVAAPSTHSNSKSTRPTIKSEPVPNFQVVQPAPAPAPPTISQPPVSPVISHLKDISEELKQLNQKESDVNSKIDELIKKLNQLSESLNISVDLPPLTRTILHYKLEHSQSNNTSMTTVALNDSNAFNTSDSNLPNIVSAESTSPPYAADNETDARDVSTLPCGEKMTQEELELLSQDILKLDDVDRVLEKFGLSDDEIDLLSLPYHKVQKLKKYVSKKLRKKEKSDKKERHRRKEEEIALRYTTDSNLQPDYARSLFTSQLESAANQNTGDSPASSLLFPLPQLTSQVDQEDNKSDVPAMPADLRPCLNRQSSLSPHHADLEQETCRVTSGTGRDWNKSSQLSPPAPLKREPDLTTASGTPSSQYSTAPKSVELAASVKTSGKSSQSDSSSESEDEEETKPRWGSQLFQSKAFLGNRHEQSKSQQEKSNEAKKAQQQAVARMIENEAKRASQLSEKETASRIARERAEEAVRRQKEEALVKSAHNPKARQESKMEAENRKRADMERRKAHDRRKREEIYRNFPPSPINSHELLCYFENKMDPYLFELFKI